jgi:hypothetical protein
MADDKRKPGKPRATTPAEGKAPELPKRRNQPKGPRPSDRLGHLEDFLPSD